MVTVRPYKREDRIHLESICIATGLRGQLGEHFCDQELFARLWLSPYLDAEPENAFTVEIEGKVAGYLVGTFSDHYAWRVLRVNGWWLMVLILRWLRGRYRHHPESSRFVRWLLFRSWRESPRTPRKSGHFHFNLAPEVRGKEIGDQLVEAFEARLTAQGRLYWYAVVFSSEDHRPLRMYRRMGFEIFDCRPCTLFNHPTNIACILKHIADSSNRKLTL